MDKRVYTRPNKPVAMTVTPRRAATPPQAGGEAINTAMVEVDRDTECHVTPMAVAHRMVDYLGGVGDYLTLEPSAGTGNLLGTLLEQGQSPYELVAIERHYGLCKVIRQRFSTTRPMTAINECFLTYAKKAHARIEYPRIIMNPPFKKVRQHMQAALSLLGKADHSEAVLVALVPVTYQHEDMEIMEVLPSNTFASTTLSTHIVRFTL